MQGCASALERAKAPTAQELGASAASSAGLKRGSGFHHAVLRNGDGRRSTPARAGGRCGSQPNPV
jgi:hypothetical protein